MKINDKNIDIEEAIIFADHDNLLLKHQKYGIILSDYQVNILKNNGFNFGEYSNMKELLFDIELYLNDEYDQELDLISKQIAELIYYRDTKK